MPHPTFIPSQESSEWFQGTPPSPLKSGLAGRMLVSHLNPRSCSLSWQNNPNQTAHQCLFIRRFSEQLFTLFTIIAYHQAGNVAEQHSLKKLTDVNGARFTDLLLFFQFLIAGNRLQFVYISISAK